MAGRKGKRNVSDHRQKDSREKAKKFARQKGLREDLWKNHPAPSSEKRDGEREWKEK